MNFIAISFTLKNQPFADIQKVLQMISSQFGGASGNTVLVHGFMPRDVVVAKGFDTEVVDGLKKLFPLQINCYDTAPIRSQMVDIIKRNKGRVFVVGTVIDGVAEEVALYEAAGVKVQELGLDFANNWTNEPLSYGKQAVGLLFNPSGDDSVGSCKLGFADLIDQMNDLRSADGPAEQKRLCSVAITEAQTAQMWAVKALTWK